MIIMTNTYKHQANRPGSASWSQTVHWHLRGPFGKHRSYRNSVSSPCDLQTDQDNLKLSRHFMINTTNTHKKSLQACTQPRQYRQYCKLKVQLQRKHEKTMLARIDPFQQPRLQRCRSRAHIFSSWTVHHLSSRHSRHTLFVWQRMTTNTHHQQLIYNYYYNFYIYCYIWFHIWLLHITTVIQSWTSLPLPDSFSKGQGMNASNDWDSNVEGIINRSTIIKYEQFINASKHIHNSHWA